MDIQNELLRVFPAFLTAALITFLFVRFIISFVRDEKIYDEIDLKVLYLKVTAILGGLGIFIGFVLSYTFWSSTFGFHEFKYILTGVILLFFIGLIDDVIGLTPNKKLIAQILASVIIIYFGGIRITDLYGVFGIHALPEWASIGITLLAIIGITNSFNLIDGIDGLAGGIGMIISATFGIIFFVGGEYAFSTLAFALCGSLVAFLYFNFHPAKIFMGDTGAFIIGFVVSILAVKFIEFNSMQHLEANVSPLVFSAPAVGIGILILPVFDTLRVFVVRIINGHSPFTSDLGHIHHLLLDKGFNPLQACVILYAVNIFFIFEVLALQNIGTVPLLLLVVGTALFFTFLLTRLPHKESIRSLTKEEIKEYKEVIRTRLGQKI